MINNCQALDKGTLALGLSKDLQEGVLFLCASAPLYASHRPPLLIRPCTEAGTCPNVCSLTELNAQRHVPMGLSIPMFTSKQSLKPEWGSSVLLYTLAGSP